MAGDPMVAGISLPALLAVGGALLGGVWGLLKWFAGRLLADIEQRLRRIDELENRFERLMADLPLHYIRREDHIRDMSAITTRLDRIHEMLIMILKEARRGE